MKRIQSSIDKRRERNATSGVAGSRSRSCRAAFTLLEVTVAFVIIGAAMATLTQAIWLTRQHTRSLNRHFVATNELANVMERLALVPYDQLTNDRLPKFAPSPELLQVAKNAKIVVEVYDLSEKPVGKQVRAKVLWPLQSIGASVNESRENSRESTDKKQDDTGNASSRDLEVFELVTFRFSSGGKP